VVILELVSLEDLVEQEMHQHPVIKPTLVEVMHIGSNLVVEGVGELLEEQVMSNFQM
jgi:hypothetical protein